MTQKPAPDTQMQLDLEASVYSAGLQRTHEANAHYYDTDEDYDDGYMPARSARKATWPAPNTVKRNTDSTEGFGGLCYG